MIRERLDKLRALMGRDGLDAYLILTQDFHGSEYVGDFFKCRRYMSGFTGSAGSLLVMKDMAGLWTDGRYFLQAEQELKGTGITLFKMQEEGVPKLSDFLADKLPDGGKLGFDGRAVNFKTAQNLSKVFAEKEKKIALVYDKDLVGEVWEDRPALKANPVMLLDLSCTGKSRADKLSDIRGEMAKKKADYFILSSLDDIAWLLNIRGGDVDCNPVVLSYLAVTGDSAILFINEQTLSGKVREALVADGIAFAPYNAVYDFVKQIPDGKSLYV
ncbi:MAG: aminopeptidase P family N-terminal domain-containing protein, partial [Lachnospiraceae bacterium]|nr:aminopeptidase P family N-terminal domain-containing protein [Lachnospiraceae bacterium]